VWCPANSSAPNGVASTNGATSAATASMVSGATSRSTIAQPAPRSAAATASADVSGGNTGTAIAAASGSATRESLADAARRCPPHRALDTGDRDLPRLREQRHAVALHGPEPGGRATVELGADLGPQRAGDGLGRERLGQPAFDRQQLLVFRAVLDTAAGAFD